jgi:tetratricopeptide (TPR) repeat protein
MDIDEAIRWLSPGDEVETKNLIERQARRADGTIPQAWVWLVLGDRLYQADAYDRARACYSEAYRADANDSVERRVRASIGIGNSLLMEEDYFGAKDAYQRALADAQRGGFQKGVAEAAVQLSEVERALGSLSAAEGYARQALSLNIELNREQTLIRVARSLASLARYLEASTDATGARSLLAWSTTQLRRASGSESARQALAIITAAQGDVDGNSEQGQSTR